MSALEAIQSTLALEREAAYSNKTGGTSEGNVQAGIDTKDVSNKNAITVTQKDKVSAAIVTAITLVVFMMLAVWMLI
ncbi:unnamed protein product [Ambrosiozyma monospora]|uniref:Unnamed protein product n=1 Tax=Ambrosiozyma monospora TaxID=43982 RepID=A0A9W6YZC1_AMBMO|nr:unnamed protein product [Ambrosiozyma monospora]